MWVLEVPQGGAIKNNKKKGVSYDTSNKQADDAVGAY